MTLEQLQSCSRKRLAQLAKAHQIPQWHRLRKNDLIDALDQLYQSQPHILDQPLQGAENPRRTPIKVSQRISHNFQSSPKKTVPINIPAADFKPLKGPGSEDWLQLQVLDKHWLKANWQLTTSSIRRAEVALGAEWRQAVPTLRLIQINPENPMAAENVAEQISISGHSHEWYLTVPTLGEEYKMEIGLLTPSNRFYVLLKSEKTKTESDSAFSLPPHQEAYTASDVHSSGSQTSCKQDLEGIATLLRGRNNSENDEFSTVPFGVEVQVTIKGVADPAAKVTMNDEWIDVHDDGTFQIDLPLSDGRQVLPIVQMNHDGREKRTIILALEQHCREMEPQIAKSLLHSKPR